MLPRKAGHQPLAYIAIFSTNLSLAIRLCLMASIYDVPFDSHVVLQHLKVQYALRA